MTLEMYRPEIITILVRGQRLFTTWACSSPSMGLPFRCFLYLASKMHCYSFPSLERCHFSSIQMKLTLFIVRSVTRMKPWTNER